MSSLITSNISDGTTSVPTGYVVNGSAKVWSNTSQAATYAIRDSLNLSSVNDNGTGSTTFNFTSAFNSANHAVSGMASNDNNNLANAENDTTQTASLVRCESYDVGGNYNQDSLWTTMCVHGDLA